MSSLESLHRTSGDHRIVYECLYAYTAHHRAGFDGAYSHSTREQAVWHVTAPSYELAKAAWLHHHPKHCDYELISCVPLCTVNVVMNVASQ